MTWALMRAQREWRFLPWVTVAAAFSVVVILSVEARIAGLPQPESLQAAYSVILLATVMTGMVPFVVLPAEVRFERAVPLAPRDWALSRALLAALCVFVPFTLIVAFLGPPSAMAVGAGLVAIAVLAVGWQPPRRGVMCWVRVLLLLLLAASISSALFVEVTRPALAVLVPGVALIAGLALFRSQEWPERPALRAPSEGQRAASVFGLVWSGVPVRVMAGIIAFQVAIAIGLAEALSMFAAFVMLVFAQASKVMIASIRPLAALPVPRARVFAAVMSTFLLPVAVGAGVGWGVRSSGFPGGSHREARLSLESSRDGYFLTNVAGAGQLRVAWFGATPPEVRIGDESHVPEAKPILPGVALYNPFESLKSHSSEFVLEQSRRLIRDAWGVEITKQRLLERMVEVGDDGELEYRRGTGFSGRFANGLSELGLPGFASIVLPRALVLLVLGSLFVWIGCRPRQYPQRRFFGQLTPPGEGWMVVVGGSLMLASFVLSVNRDLAALQQALLEGYGRDLVRGSRVAWLATGIVFWGIGTLLWRRFRYMELPPVAANGAFGRPGRRAG